MKTSLHTILENQKQFGLMYAELEKAMTKKLNEVWTEEQDKELDRIFDDLTTKGIAMTKRMDLEDRLKGQIKNPDQLLDKSKPEDQPKIVTRLLETMGKPVSEMTPEDKTYWYEFLFGKNK